MHKKTKKMRCQIRVMKINLSKKKSVPPNVSVNKKNGEGFDIWHICSVNIFWIIILKTLLSFHKCLVTKKGVRRWFGWCE